MLDLKGWNTASVPSAWIIMRGGQFCICLIEAIKGKGPGYLILFSFPQMPTLSSRILVSTLGNYISTNVQAIYVCQLSMVFFLVDGSAAIVALTREGQRARKRTGEPKMSVECPMVEI